MDPSEEWVFPCTLSCSHAGTRWGLCEKGHSGSSGAQDRRSLQTPHAQELPGSTGFRKDSKSAVGVEDQAWTSEPACWAKTDTCC